MSRIANPQLVLTLIVFTTFSIRFTYATNIMNDTYFDFSKVRRRCVSDRDCSDIHKHCFEGQCYCKPHFDDVHPHDDFCFRPHGASCSDSELCNVYKNLKCKRHKCTCNGHKNQMVYDEHLQTCVVKVGHKCDLAVYSSEDDVTEKCVQHAECVPDPERTIDSPFYGICQCHKDFEQKGLGCVRKADTVCNESDCVDNTVCTWISNPHTGNKSWKCMCKEGFHENTDGSCVVDTKNDCGDNVKVYDYRKKMCATKIGEECDPWEEDSQCVSGSYCRFETNKCHCFDRYVTTEELICELRNETGAFKLTQEITTPTLLNLPNVVNEDISKEVTSGTCLKENLGFLKTTLVCIGLINYFLGIFQGFPVHN